MIGKLSPEEIEKLLKKQVMGHIACYAEGKSYIIPVSYAYDGKDIYVRSLEGKKINMMRQNPEVCFQVEDLENMAEWKSVIGWGDFEELTDPDERDKGLNILLNRILPLLSSETTHLGAYWPFPPDHLNSITGVVFRIRLGEKTGRFEKPEIPPQ
ncbi:MAG: pyridoxamine 5'-phosphate oxidase family protein [Bacteroidota bacterium]|nr:pyridoxamine 5'-phosphate oxidase family protein [Bacteroidota bacterium]